MVTVSVILPTYNSEKTIERLLHSIFTQNGIGKLFEIEVIVVDDCSTDNTVSILSKYPVRFFENEENSGGPNKGRNKGLEEATGEWIIFTDHDDSWLPDRVEKQLSCSTTSKIVSCGFQLYKNNKLTDIRFDKSDSLCVYFEENATFMKRLKRSGSGQFAFFGNLMFHRSLKHIKLEEKYGQCDVDYLLKLFEGNNSTACNKALFNRYEEGVSNLSFNERYRLNDYQVATETYEKYSNLFPEEVKVGIKRLNAAMARYYFKINKPKKARSYLLKARLGPLNMLFYLGSFLGASFSKRLIP